ncbi:MAG: hypothetical protein QM776_06030 [Rhodocyclaceae bacterium]
MSRLASLALLLCLPLLAQAQSAGRLTFTEGQVRLLRGDQVFVAPKGLPLNGEDILDTPDTGSAIIEQADGTLFSAGSNSRLMVGNGALRLMLRSGWLKLQAAEKSEPWAFSTPQGGISGKATLILRSTDSDIELFVENGEVTFNATRGGKFQVKSGQFLAQRGSKQAAVQPRPDAAFVEAMPRGFRDRLPSLAARYADARPVPRLLGEVRYDDVADWLNGPVSWRTNFVKRYESRLADPAFRSAIEANLNRHPEWARPLYPEKNQGNNKRPSGAANKEASQP